MGSKVQAELGNAAGVSLTRPGHIVPPPPAPRLRHCPWTRPPHHHGHPKVHFLFAPLLVWKAVLGFSSHEKSDGPGGRSDPRDNPPAFQRKPPKVNFLLELQQLVRSVGSPSPVRVQKQ